MKPIILALGFALIAFIVAQTFLSGVFAINNQSTVVQNKDEGHRDSTKNVPFARENDLGDGATKGLSALDLADINGDGTA